MNKRQHARRKALQEQCNVDAIAADMQAMVDTLHETFDFPEDSPEEVAMASVETFIAVALYVMKRTPPAVLRDAARTTEIRARLDGVPVLSIAEDTTT